MHDWAYCEVHECFIFVKSIEQFSQLSQNLCAIYFTYILNLYDTVMYISGAPIGGLQPRLCALVPATQCFSSLFS